MTAVRAAIHHRLATPAAKATSIRAQQQPTQNTPWPAQNVAELVKCIRLCLDCADVCAATVGVTSRQTEYDAGVTRPLLEACAATCKSCGDECERHAQMHEHCRVCAEACRRCEQACRELLAAMN